MNQDEIMELAIQNREKARSVLNESGIADVWREAGCRVNIVGSLRMGFWPLTAMSISMYIPKV